jgi:hypothetical protein
VKHSNGNGVLGTDAAESGDSNGVKYTDNAATNVNLYQPFVTKEVAKEEQSKCEIYTSVLLSMLFRENYCN